MKFRKTDDLDDLLSVPSFDYSDEGASRPSSIDNRSSYTSNKSSYTPSSYNEPEDIYDRYVEERVPRRSESNDSSINLSREDYAKARQEAEKEAYLRARHTDGSSSHRQDDFDGDNKKRRRKEKKQNKQDRKQAKAQRKQSKRRGVKSSLGNRFQRIYALIYLIFFAIFELVIGVMHILPIHYFIGMSIVLGIISLVIFLQLSYPKVKKWARISATVLATLLICVYGVASVYATNTMFFLSGISSNKVKADRVDNITKDSFNILFTGIDVEGTIEEEGRSDVNMLATINPKTAEILLTAIPRDYEVRLVNYDYEPDKITHTGFYGVDDTILAVEDLLDIDVNYYVKVNFSSVVKVVDAIGGIDVYSEFEFNPVKYPSWTVQKGVNHMDGLQALSFARERKAFAAGDNQRIKNQQLVLEAMLKKALSGRTLVLRYTKILNSMSDYMEMNLSSREARKLVRMQVARNPKWHIDKQSLLGNDASKPTYSTGGQYAYVMEADEGSVEEVTDYIDAVMKGKNLEKYRK